MCACFDRAACQFITHHSQPCLIVTSCHRRHVTCLQPFWLSIIRKRCFFQAHQVSALLPAVRLLAGRSLDGSHALEAHLEAAPLDAALSGQQLDYLRTFAAALTATFASPSAGPQGSSITSAVHLCVTECLLLCSCRLHPHRPSVSQPTHCCSRRRVAGSFEW